MALALAGQPMPPAPAIVGRVHGADGLGAKAEALLVLAFGKDGDDGSARPVRGAAATGLRAVLLEDP
jgi:hypothetical protein